jgi:hypothetical protein
MTQVQHKRWGHPFNFRERLREISMFFQGTDPVHETMRRVAGKLAEAKIDHAIVGAMAVNAHGHRRTTEDVDFLLTSAGLAAFVRLYGDRDFDRVPGRSRRFVDRKNDVIFDVLLTGMYPGSGKPGPISYPHPAQVRETIQDLHVIDLPTLIQLKLAARRYKDFGDVVSLIAVKNLDESFQEKLHPSVRADYIECLEEKRREDEYEARQDEAFRQMDPTQRNPRSGEP